MTNEEAILILKHIKELHDMDPEIITEEDVKALDRAIKGLKFIKENFPASFVYYLDIHGEFLWE